MYTVLLLMLILKRHCVLVFAVLVVLWGTCVSAQCSKDEECPVYWPFCRSGQCQECRSDSDCPNAYRPSTSRCNDGICAQCQSNKDCESGNCSFGTCTCPVCLPGSLCRGQECKPECIEDSECTGGDICEGWSYWGRVCGPCEELSHRGCGSNQWCLTSPLSPKPECRSCRKLGSPCPKTEEFCNPSTLTCGPHECEANSECPIGLVCNTIDHKCTRCAPYTTPDPNRPESTVHDGCNAEGNPHPICIPDPRPSDLFLWRCAQCAVDQDCAQRKLGDKCVNHQCEKCLGDTDCTSHAPVNPWCLQKPNSKDKVCSECANNDKKGCKIENHPMCEKDSKGENHCVSCTQNTPGSLSADLCGERYESYMIDPTMDAKPVCKGKKCECDGCSNSNRDNPHCMRHPHPEFKFPIPICGHYEWAGDCPETDDNGSFWTCDKAQHTPSQSLCDWNSHQSLFEPDEALNPCSYYGLNARCSICGTGGCRETTCVCPENKTGEHCQLNSTFHLIDVNAKMSVTTFTIGREYEFQFALSRGPWTIVLAIQDRSGNSVTVVSSSNVNPANGRASLRFILYRTEFICQKLGRMILTGEKFEGNTLVSKFETALKSYEMECYDWIWERAKCPGVCGTAKVNSVIKCQKTKTLFGSQVIPTIESDTSKCTPATTGLKTANAVDKTVDCGRNPEDIEMDGPRECLNGGTCLLGSNCDATATPSTCNTCSCPAIVSGDTCQDTGKVEFMNFDFYQFEAFNSTWIKVPQARLVIGATYHLAMKINTVKWSDVTITLEFVDEKGDKHFDLDLTKASTDLANQLHEPQFEFTVDIPIYPLSTKGLIGSWRATATANRVLQISKQPQGWGELWRYSWSFLDWSNPAAPQCLGNCGGQKLTRTVICWVSGPDNMEGEEDTDETWCAKKFTGVEKKPETTKDCSSSRCMNGATCWGDTSIVGFVDYHQCDCNGIPGTDWKGGDLCEVDITDPKQNTKTWLHSLYLSNDADGQQHVTQLSRGENYYVQVKMTDQVQRDWVLKAMMKALPTDAAREVKSWKGNDLNSPISLTIPPDLGLTNSVALMLELSDSGLSRVLAKRTLFNLRMRSHSWSRPSDPAQIKALQASICPTLPATCGKPTFDLPIRCARGPATTPRPMPISESESTIVANSFCINAPAITPSKPRECPEVAECERNQGTCGDDGHCECMRGFSGTLCEFTAPDFCQENAKCANDGFVIEDPSTSDCQKKCTCLDGWKNTQAAENPKSGKKPNGCTECSISSCASSGLSPKTGIPNRLCKGCTCRRGFVRDYNVDEDNCGCAAAYVTMGFVGLENYFQLGNTNENTFHETNAETKKARKLYFESIGEAMARGINLKAEGTDGAKAQTVEDFHVAKWKVIKDPISTGLMLEVVVGYHPDCRRQVQAPDLQARQRALGFGDHFGAFDNFGTLGHLRTLETGMTPANFDLSPFEPRPTATVYPTALDLGNTIGFNPGRGGGRGGVDLAKLRADAAVKRIHFGSPFLMKHELYEESPYDPTTDPSNFPISSETSHPVPHSRSTSEGGSNTIALSVATDHTQHYNGLAAGQVALTQVQDVYDLIPARASFVGTRLHPNFRISVPTEAKIYDPSCYDQKTNPRCPSDKKANPFGDEELYPGDPLPPGPKKKGIKSIQWWVWLCVGIGGALVIGLVVFGLLMCRAKNVCCWGGYKG